MPSFSFWVFAVLNFTQKKQIFLVYDPVGPFSWVQGNNSGKKRQIELKFWPQAVFIIVQIPFKEFWKSQIFTEKGRTQNVSFWSNFDSNKPPEDG